MLNKRICQKYLFLVFFQFNFLEKICTWQTNVDSILPLLYIGLELFQYQIQPLEFSLMG